MSKNSDSTAGQQRGRPFVKGRSGNPRGRRVGSKNTVTLRHEIWEIVQRTGSTTPIEFLLATMNDARRPIATRLRAAELAAPLLHPQCAPTTAAPQIDPPPPPRPMSNRERARQAALGESLEDIADRLAGLL